MAVDPDTMAERVASELTGGERGVGKGWRGFPQGVLGDGLDGGVVRDQVARCDGPLDGLG